MNPFAQVLGLNRLDHLQRSRTDEGIAAEGGRVVPRLQGFASDAASEASADWQTVTQALGRRHHVGKHAGLHVAEVRTGPGVARLDLVKHQQPVLFITDATQLRQIVVRGNVDAGFTLNGLDQDGDDVGTIVGDVLNRADVIEGCADETFNQGLKSGLHLAIAGCRQRCHCSPMERLVGDDNGWAGDAFILTVQSGDLDRRLVGLRA